MGPIISWLKNISWRARTQFISLLAINSYFLPQLRSICVPAFNCYSCPAAIFSCPLGVLANFSALKLVPYSAIAILVLAGLIGGRLVCGWICPFGLIQDWLDKIRRRKIVFNPKFRFLKYGILMVFIFAIPFFFPGPILFCRLCPVGTIESTIPWRLMGVVNTFTSGFYIRLGVLAVILMLVSFSSRGFCKYLCPLGVIFGFFNRFSLVRMKMKDDCNECRLCAKKCPVDINPVGQRNNSECIRCGQCTHCNQIAFGIK